jgi:CubicO group peptidase (beta-lactamase class C family)
MTTLTRCLAVLFLAGLVAAPVPAPAKDPAAAISPALQPYVDAGTLAGAVTLVADKDKVLDLEAVGYADVAAKKPLKTDALFWIASMSKPITAAGVMILVDEGKVKLDDPIEKYLPEFKGQMVVAERDGEHVLLKKPKRPPTVRDALRHTSGMPFQSLLEQPKLDRLPLRDAARSYALTPLEYEPGTRYAYSNAGINTTGRIIEVVTGMSYEAFMDKRLFGPLGMKDTTFWPNEEQLSRLAKSYRPDPKAGLVETLVGQLTYPLTDRKRQPMPAGGLFATADDVGRFCRMVLNGGTFEGKRYLSAEAVKEMTTRQTPEPLQQNYGLGWSTGGTFGHGGAYATNMTIDPKKGLITVYMVQHAGFPGNGGMSLGAFRKAAEEKFGMSK